MSHDHLISVQPTQGGWRVSLDDLQPLMFLSGRAAEQHARGLASRLASLGADSRVLLHDRTSALVAAQRYFGD